MRTRGRRPLDRSWPTHSRLCAALVAVVLSAGPAAAQIPLPAPAEVPPHSPLPADSLRGVLARKPTCTSLTNDCQMCVVRDGHIAGCSTPGIACQPGPWRCTSSQARGIDSLLLVDPAP